MAEATAPRIADDDLEAELFGPTKVSDEKSRVYNAGGFVPLRHHSRINSRPLVRHSKRHPEPSGDSHWWYAVTPKRLAEESFALTVVLWDFYGDCQHAQAVLDLGVWRQRFRATQDETGKIHFHIRRAKNSAWQLVIGRKEDGVYDISSLIGPVDETPSGEGA